MPAGISQKLCHIAVHLYAPSWVIESRWTYVDDSHDVSQVGSEASKVTGRLPEAPLFVARSPADKSTDHKTQWLERYQQLNPSSTAADASQGKLWLAFLPDQQ